MTTHRGITPTLDELNLLRVHPADALRKASGLGLQTIHRAKAGESVHRASLRVLLDVARSLSAATASAQTATT